MGKSLVITEKPSVARDVASALEGFREEDGYFESDDFVVTFAVGHLFELLPPEEVDEKYKRWTLDALPILPEKYQYKPKKGQAQRIRTIKKLLARDDVDAVVNACDAGREGELIFREIVDHLGSEKPIRRLWLQSMTDAAIRRGFQELRPGEELEGLAAAAECRARSDWLIGMNATRAFTKRLKTRKEKTAWSAGRVQTPTLAMLVGREFEILAHVPRPFWRVTGTFAHDGQTYDGVWFDPDFQAGDDAHAREDRIFDEARARAIVEAVSGGAGTATETRKPSRESAPPLFDLTSLQRECNRRFGWSARRALSSAQRCYERHKVLTYPRTDSRCLPSDYRDTVRGVLDEMAARGQSDLSDLRDYARSAATLRRDGLQNEKRVFDDGGVSDHFAIIPTGTLPGAALGGDDQRLFDLVVRRFLGAFFPPAVWERVERITEVSGERFRTRARHLKETGWREVLPTTDEEEDTVLAPLAPGRDSAEGVAVETRAADLSAEETKPPARITEARILSLMENAGRQIDDESLAAVLHEKGIGTPATRADIIENLISKGYVGRVDKALRPTVKGIRLIDTLHKINVDRLTSPELTGEIEHHLLEVERGRRLASDFMSEIQDYACAIVERAKHFEYDELYDDGDELGPCPACGRPVVERVWFYRCREDPDADEDCPMRFWKDTSGRYLDRQTIVTLLQDGHTPELDGFTARNGRTYRGTLEVDRDEWKLVVRSTGWNEGQFSETPEYEVDDRPLGPCRCTVESQVVETPTHFVCRRKLVEDERAAELKGLRKQWKAEGRSPKEIRDLAAEHKAGNPEPPSCGFVLPRTVCKREITRDEALVYLKEGRTELLEDFTSRFGRPFSATLVLKENGRHGFEFPPRTGRRGAAAGTGDDAQGAKAPAAGAGATRGGSRSGRGGKKAGTRKAATAGGSKAGAASPRRKAAAKSPRKKKTARKTRASAPKKDPSASD